MNEYYSTWKEKRGSLKNNVSINQISSHVIKMASKRARLSETERFIKLWHAGESLWNILSDNYKIRQEKEKKVLVECWKNYKWQVITHFFKIVLWIFVLWMTTTRGVLQKKVFCLWPAILLKKSVWHRYFPVKFAKFLRKPILYNNSWWLLLE